MVLVEEFPEEDNVSSAELTGFSVVRRSRTKRTRVSRRCIAVRVGKLISEWVLDQSVDIRVL